MPQAQITDAKDQLIGYKDRDSLGEGDTWRIICVDIRDMSGNYVLVQKRSMQKKLGPGLWTLAVAWTLEGDDTFDSCATREIQEELGIEGIKPLFQSKIFYSPTETIGSRITCLYEARIPKDTPFVLQEEEVEEIRWVEKGELIKWLQTRPMDFTQWAHVAAMLVGILSNDPKVRDVLRVTELPR